MGTAARGDGAVHDVKVTGDAAQLPPVNGGTHLYFRQQPLPPHSDCPLAWLKTNCVQPVGVVRDWITETAKKTIFQYVLNVIALDSEWNANRVYSLSDNDWVDGADHFC